MYSTTSYHTSPYNPLISVIIAVYNGGRYLEGAIKSIINQEYKNYEIIIIDGGSNDNSVQIIDKYSSYIQYAISEQDNGIYDAWNKGLTAASGSWIVFIGADDILYPHAFKMYIDYIERHPNRDNLEFISSKIEFVDNNLNVLKVLGEAWSWPQFKKRMVTWHVGTFHSSKLFKKYGSFDDSYKISGDYEFLLRPKDQLVAAFFSDITVRMRDGGVSSALSYKTIDEVYKAKIHNAVTSRSMGSLLIAYSKMKLFIKRIIHKTGYKFI